MFTDGDNDNGRTINEKEVRAVATALLLAVQYARRTIGRWLVAKKRPTLDELLQLSLSLKGLEDEIMRMAQTPESDASSLDELIDIFSREIEKLNQEKSPQ